VSSASIRGPLLPAHSCPLAPDPCSLAPAVYRKFQKPPRFIARFSALFSMDTWEGPACHRIRYYPKI
jgi:hypothetical protein